MSTTDNHGARPALKVAVIERSVGDIWSQARLEWTVSAVTVDPAATGVCVCGQTGLYYRYTIANVLTGSQLCPIGSDCIDHFGVGRMAREQLQLRELLELEAAATSGGLVWTTDVFSRSKLRTLYVYGAWAPSKYNHGDPAEDLDFMLDMFNKRSPATSRQAYRRTQLLRAAGDYLRATAAGTRPRTRVYEIEGASSC